MLFSILLIVSVLITLLLIYFIQLPFEKMPIFIAVLVSGITSLFTYITSQTLSLWLGLLFFFGILVSATILLGKRKTWLRKKEETGQVQIPKRSFHKEMKHFENPQGRSIYEEEKSPLYISKIMIDEDPTIIENHSFEDFLLKKQEDEVVTIENNQNELDSVVELPGLEIILPIIELEETVEPIVPDLDYVATLQEVAMTEVDIDLKSTEELVQTATTEFEQMEDIEELSDKWMARRFDALLALEEKPLQKSFQEPVQETLIRPNLDDLSSTIEMPVKEYDKINDFEDISALYFNGQRSDLDGTKE